MAMLQDLDVITIGRSSLDLYGADIGVELADVSLFRSSVGGSPTNIAIGAARLELKSALLTRVGADPFGKTILTALTKEGVDTSAIVKDPERQTALVLLAVEDSTHSPHVFYRNDCADMALSEDDVDSAFIARTKSIVVTGTHFSTSGVAAASWKAIRLAKEHSAKIIFDIDFRPSLWGLAAHADGASRAAIAPEVTKAFSSIIEVADLVVGTEEEINAAAGCVDVDTALSVLRKISAATLVCKRGAYGCDVYPGGETKEVLEAPVHGKSFSVDVVNNIGAGDAFLAGFLRGYLKDEPLETCATYANANGAFAVTKLLCSQDYAHWPSLQRLVSSGNILEAEEIEHNTVFRRHRSGEPDREVYFLACDHRSQFRDIALAVGADHSRFGAFKRLALEAVSQTGQQYKNVGLIVDEEYGREALSEASRRQITCARPIEIPGSRPIEFVTGKDVGTALITWPRNQIVKCLCHYDPEDETSLLYAQQYRLLQVQQACQRTGHKFLLEVIPPKTMKQRATAVQVAMQQLYELGIRPEYWKLEPFSENADWEKIAQIIHSNDPNCDGVLILGQLSSMSDIEQSFSAASATPWVRGFAIGRAIVGEAFEQWLVGELDDRDAITKMAHNFSYLIQAWQQHRSPHLSE